MTASIWSASAPAPVPLAIARSMLSFGMRASLAFCTAWASVAFMSGSPPPSRAATWIARASFVKCAPRRASTTAFLCLIDAHLEWPAMAGSLRAAQRSDDEPAVALQLDAVDRDRAALAQIADQVPVHGGLVCAACLGVARADGHVHRAADLLLEQDLLGGRGDRVVGPDPELAEGARAVVGVERV